MPSPVPRRDWSSRVARGSTSGGLPHRSGGSAPASRVSRSVRRSLALWPAWSLTPRGSRFPECFSPSRYLLEPPQVLPVGATSDRAGLAPARIDTPLHGTQTDARKTTQEQNDLQPPGTGSHEEWSARGGLPRAGPCRAKAVRDPPAPSVGLAGLGPPSGNAPRSPTVRARGKWDLGRGRWPSPISC